MSASKWKSTGSIPDEPTSGLLCGNIKSRYRTCPPTNLQYNPEISLTQLIECKRREIRVQARPPKASSQEEREYGEELFDSIEAFLDKQGMFIVSPSPTKLPRKYNINSSIQTKYQDYYPQEAIEEPASPYVINEINLFQSNSTDLPASEVTKKPFLGKVAGSSLFQRRRKVEASESVLAISRSENNL